MKSLVSVIEASSKWVLATAVLASCAKPAYEVTTAPTSQKEAGYIVELKSEQLEALKNQNSGFGIRAIAQDQGIYEVTNLSLANIKKVSPALVEKNVYIENLVSTKKPLGNSAVIQSAKKTDATPAQKPHEGQNQKPFNIPNSTPFSTCVNKPEVAPVISIDSPSSFAESGIPTIELGKEVKLTASASKPHESNFSSRLRYLWRAEVDPKIGLMSFPELSALKPFMSEGSGVTLTPDMVGTYTLILLVQDNQNVCAMAPVSFVVTANPGLKTELITQPTKTVDLKFFPHLKTIEADSAWANNAKGEGIVIAVLDTGVNYNHVGIVKNIFIDEKELNRDNTDSDGNKLIDDYIGWDFVNGDNAPFDDQGHGSHVSGLAASTAMGVAPSAKVMPVKILNGFGGGDVASIAAGIFYAANKGANVINMSLGGNFKEFDIIQKAIDFAESKGVLIVIAAGNGDEKGVGYDIDDAKTENIYPAEFTNENILVVAAAGLDDKLTSYSNFGATSVDLAAPGGDFQKPLFSLSTENPKHVPFVPSQGTSMASPVVAGAAAALWSANPTLTAKQVKAALMNTSRKSPNLKGKVVSEGHLSLGPTVVSVQK